MLVLVAQLVKGAALHCDGRRIEFKGCISSKTRANKWICWGVRAICWGVRAFFLIFKKESGCIFKFPVPGTYTCLHLVTPAYSRLSGLTPLANPENPNNQVLGKSDIGLSRVPAPAPPPERPASRSERERSPRACCHTNAARVDRQSTRARQAARESSKRPNRSVVLLGSAAGQRMRRVA